MSEEVLTGRYLPTVTKVDRTVKEEEQALVRAIQRTQGFGLFFAICTSVETAAVAGRLQQALKDMQVSLLELEDTEQDRRLASLVKTLMLNRPNTETVLVIGLENWLKTSSSKEQAQWVLSHLNQQREWFREQFSVRLVFVVSPTVLTQMIRQAPDFFDWRSGVFNYASDPKTLARESVRILAEGDYGAYCTWSAEERNQRLLEIQSLAEELDGNLDRFYFEQGLIFAAGEEYESSVVSFDKAALINPKRHEALNNKGVSLGSLGRYEEAIAAYDAALEIQPDNHKAFYNKACCYGLQGKVESALENLERAIQLNPDQCREMAKTDTDFDAIRDDLRFRALVEGGEE